MNYENSGDVEGWDWQGRDCIFDKNVTGAEVSESLTSALNQDEDHFNCLFDDKTTPLKACGAISYHLACNEVRSKELEQYEEPYSQAKRRRVLHFEPDFPSPTPCNEKIFLRSNEMQYSYDDDISQLVAGFTEIKNASSDELPDSSSEAWIDDCINNNEMQYCAEDMITSGVSHVQIDVSGNAAEFDANVAEKLPIHTCRNVALKGKKSSTIVYPFTFIKPCGAHGDVTLSDINQRLHTPKSKKTEQDPSPSYPTSAFSGKPVVGKTKICTEGGDGSITIVRTKG